MHAARLSLHYVIINAACCSQKRNQSTGNFQLIGELAGAKSRSHGNLRESCVAAAAASRQFHHSATRGGVAQETGGDEQKREEKTASSGTAVEKVDCTKRRRRPTSKNLV